MRLSTTGEIGDGRIFISEVLETIHIRTGKRGDETLYIAEEEKASVTL